MPIVLKSGSLNIMETSRSVQTCNGIALPFYPQNFKRQFPEHSNQKVFIRLKRIVSLSDIIV
jgi:hypothetical protein